MTGNPKEMQAETDLTRRTFLGGLALAGAVLTSCGISEKESAGPAARKLVSGPEAAPDGPPLKAGLIGCGGRGSGAAQDFLAAGPNLQLTALADVFRDRLDDCRRTLRENLGVEVAEEACFFGFDAYQRLIDSGVDIVLLATPPHFRPQHFEAAVTARKHVFMEKPLAVDPVGVRSILTTSDRADAFGLSVVTGTQFRHQKSFIETYNRIADGAIGEILAARCYSLRSQLWYRLPREDWSEMESMLRDWVNWQWLSGDHIVEQHIHGLDVIHWFTGSRPERVVAVGGRARRVTGDQYDFFSSDYELENGIHVASYCRQIDGCTNNISRWVEGTRGYTNCADTIFDTRGEILWKYEDPGDNSPYVQEHIDLVTSIRNNQPINEAPVTAASTLQAIMARESAYSGREITWGSAMQSDQRLGPPEYALGPVEIKREVPLPGTPGGTRTGES